MAQPADVGKERIAVPMILVLLLSIMIIGEESGAATFSITIRQYLVERVGPPAIECPAGTIDCDVPSGCVAAVGAYLADAEQQLCMVDVRVRVGGGGTSGARVSGAVTLWDNDTCRDWGEPIHFWTCGQTVTPYARTFTTTVDSVGWEIVVGPFPFKATGVVSECETPQVDARATQSGVTKRITRHPTLCA